MNRLFRWATVTLSLTLVSSLQAQITDPRTLSAQTDRFATLEEQLTNRLKATRDDQREYIRIVVDLVRDGKLDTKLVVAIERYALRRNPHFPFPFFERALRFEATKRGIPLPSLLHLASTRTVDVK